MDVHPLGQPGRLEPGQLPVQHDKRRLVLVAHVEIDVGRGDDMGADQHALEHAMWV